MEPRLEPGMKLGEVMVSLGLLTKFQVEATLCMQYGTDKKFGEMLIALGEASPDEVDLALQAQRRAQAWLF